MSEKNYLDFDLLIERSEEGYTARVLDSPAGQASSHFGPPFSDLELEVFVLRVGRTRRGVRRLESPEMEEARKMGGQLFDAVFGEEMRSCLRRSLDTANRQGVGLRLRLRLDAPELADWPWEYLYDPTLDRFFSLSTKTPLLRYLDLPEPVQPWEVEPPLRVLVMISSPRDYPALDVEREWSKLKEAVSDLERRGKLVLERLGEATLTALQRQLRRGEYHVFHFVGHGAFDERAQDGVLLLEDEENRGRPVSGRYLGTLLHDHESLRLAILNSCEGARTSHSDPFAGSAQSLVQQGIPAIIAMQFEITDGAAITLAHEFYAALADDYPVDAALAEARKAIFARGNDVEWGTPVLYLRAPDGQIFDVEPASAEERRQAPVAARTMVPEERARPRQRFPSIPANWRRIGIPVALVVLLLVCGYAAIKLFGPGVDGQPTPTVMGSATPVARVSEPADTPAPIPTAAPTTLPGAMPASDCTLEAAGSFADLWLAYRSQLGCPLQREPQLGAYDLEQQFENGHMWYRADSNYTYVLQGAESGTFQALEAAWTEGNGEYSCPASPPQGLIQPRWGFGWVWCQLGGADAAIGWALGEEAAPTIQEFERGVIFASSEGMAGRWAYVLFSDDETFVRESY